MAGRTHKPVANRAAGAIDCRVPENDRRRGLLSIHRRQTHRHLFVGEPLLFEGEFAIRPGCLAVHQPTCAGRHRRTGSRPALSRSAHASGSPDLDSTSPFWRVPIAFTLPSPSHIAGCRDRPRRSATWVRGTKFRRILTIGVLATFAPLPYQPGTMVAAELCARCYGPSRNWSRKSSLWNGLRTIASDTPFSLAS